MASTSNQVLLDVDDSYHTKGHRRTHSSGGDSISLNDNHIIIGHSNSNSGHHSSSSSSSSGGMHSFGKGKPSIREVVMFYRRRLFKLLVLMALCLAVAGVYLEFFKHPPPDVLLVMNKQALADAGGSNAFGADAFRKSSGGKPHVDDNGNDGDDDVDDDAAAGGDEDGDENEDEEETEEVSECEEDDGDCPEKEEKPSLKLNNKKSSRNGNSKRDVSEVEDAKYWQTFLKRNNFVPIGAVYDKCENWQHQYGTVILMKDPEFGGVKSRTFINVTLDKEISTGQFNIEVKYNGQDLYDNYWDVCEVEDELPLANRTFPCPVQPGRHSKVRDRHVPSYLPTGHYQTKAWITDELEKVIACAYADFKL